jgi:N-acylneuraminate cytidylyltransferase
MAVVPARAGSKGLPGKNLKPILGRPLFEWSILAAIRCELIGKVVISTNDDQIVSHIAANYPDSNKVNLVVRPDSLCTDVSSTEDALIHALDHFDPDGDCIDWVVTLQPTSPIRTNNLIESCFSKLLSHDADSLMTISRHTPFFYHINSDSLLEPIQHDPCDRPMKQDIEDWMFHDNGNVYISSPEVLKQTNCRIGKCCVGYETDLMQSLQIDTIEEFDNISHIASKYKIL